MRWSWPSRLLVISLALVTLLAAGGCGTAAKLGGAAAPNSGSGEQALQVVASFFPIYDLVRQVGGDRVQVSSLIPLASEPHDWEPSPRELRQMEQARLFFYLGAGLEPWAPRVLEATENPSRIARALAEGLPLLPAGAADHPGHDGNQEAHGHGREAGADHSDNHGDSHSDSHSAEESAGHDGEESGWDPHVWLDPVLVQQMVMAIRDQLSQVDPAGAELYERNAAALVQELQELDAGYQQLASCPRKDLILSHAFFGYPAQRYGLRQIGISGLSPEAEPGPRELAQLVEEAREVGATHIFFESLASDRVARTIAQEVGAETLVLNPGEGLTPAEQEAGKGLTDILRENLSNLRTGLGCSGS